MSSKRAIRRAQRRRGCIGKRRFRDPRAAMRAIRHLVLERGYQGHLSPYRCRFCGAWHFGHTPGRNHQ